MREPDRTLPCVNWAEMPRGVRRERKGGERETAETRVNLVGIVNRWKSEKKFKYEKKERSRRYLLQVGLFCLSGCIGESSQEQLLWGWESTNTGQGGGETLDFDSTRWSEIESRCSCYKCITNPKGKSGIRMTLQSYLKLRHVAWVFTLPSHSRHQQLYDMGFPWKGNVSDCDRNILHAWRGTQLRDISHHTQQLGEWVFWSW